MVAAQELLNILLVAPGLVDEGLDVGDEPLPRDRSPFCDGVVGSRASAPWIALRLFQRRKPLSTTKPRIHDMTRLPQGQRTSRGISGQASSGVETTRSCFSPAGRASPNGSPTGPGVRDSG
jgi:hypothetical protein